MKLPTSSDEESENRHCGALRGEDARSGEQAAEVEFVFRLYTSGHSPNSERARRQLVQLCEAYLGASYHIEYVDVWENSSIALADRVFVTPALRKVKPAPTTLIFGDLSEVDLVLGALGIEAGLE